MKTHFSCKSALLSLSWKILQRSKKANIANKSLILNGHFRRKEGLIQNSGSCWLLRGSWRMKKHWSCMSALLCPSWEIWQRWKKANIANKSLRLNGYFWRKEGLIQNSGSCWLIRGSWRTKQHLTFLSALPCFSWKILQRSKKLI